MEAQRVFMKERGHQNITSGRIGVNNRLMYTTTTGICKYPLSVIYRMEAQTVFIQERDHQNIKEWAYWGIV